MPKLLQINATCNIGSTGRIAEQIAMMASSNGWKCYIAHGGRYVGSSAFNAIQVSSLFDNYLHIIDSVLFGRHGLGSSQATIKFIDTVNKIKPDVIHLHNIHGYFINYQILFKYLKSSNIPVVWTFHDCWPITGQCTHFDSVGCGKWVCECGCNNCPQLGVSYKTLVDRTHRNWQQKQEAFTSLRNLTIIPVSQWLEKIVKQSFFKEYKIQVINNGVDLNRFRPLVIDNYQELALEREKPIVLGVSSEWGKKKGLDDFIKLSAIEDFQIVLIGLTESQKKCLPRNIIAIKNTSNVDEIVKYYSIADVFVNPTYEDSFPTVNIEALACGTPVITYRTGGSPEALDESSGLIVDKGDVKGLAKAILKIINNKGNYSDKCRLRAERLFDKNERFKDYLLLYNSLLGIK